MKTLPCEHSEQSPRADQPPRGQGSSQACAAPGTENESVLSHTRLAQEPLRSPWRSRIFKGCPWQTVKYAGERDGHAEAARRSEQLGGFPHQALPARGQGSGLGTLG